MTNRKILMTIVKNSSNRIEGGQEILEINEFQLHSITKSLSLHVVNEQRKMLEWLSNEDFFNIPKNEINEILEDWKTHYSKIINNYK